MTTLVLLALAVLAPDIARAADERALAKVTDLNVKAIQAYEALEFDRARKLLKEALDLCAKSGLEKHPIAARTHFHMGVVLMLGLKQKELGAKQFQKALEITPDIKPTKNLDNPEVMEAFNEAVGSAGEGTPDTGNQPGGGGADAPTVNPPAYPPRAPRPVRPRTCPPDDDDCQEQGGDGEEKAGPPFFIGLMGGSGWGYATGFAEVYPANKVTAPGFAQSGLVQLAPEVGYFVTPSLRISLQLRFQIVSGTTPINARNVPGANCGTDMLCDDFPNAVAVLARASWFFGSDTFRPYFSAAAGGGQIRHSVLFKNAPSGPICGAAGNQVCVNTVLSGPVFVGPGAGLLIAISENFGIIAEMQSVLGFPKFTFHFDLNAGVALRF